MLQLQPGVGVYTLAQLAERSGLNFDDALRLRLAMGFTEPGLDELIACDRDVEAFSTLRQTSDELGMEASLNLTRVIGASMATIAEAATSSFLVNVDFPRRQERGQLNASAPEMTEIAGSLVARLPTALDVLIRRHLLAARRTDELHVVEGFELQDTAVGFADLVNSTALGEAMELVEVGRMLAAFEKTVTTIVVRNGARTVKLIGDEIMFAAIDTDVVVRIGIEIANEVADNPELPDVRVGIAAGETLLRDGDYFGPIVNLAARLTTQAQPRTVLVASPAAAGLPEGFRVGSPSLYDLAGFHSPVAACTVELEI